MIYLITGASGNIGSYLSRDLCHNNDVILHFNRSGIKAEEVFNDILSLKGRPYLFSADLATEDGCDNLIDFFSSKFSRLDLLINSAGGIIKPTNLSSMSWSFIQDQFALNAISSMYLSTRLLPYLEKSNNGLVINISSAPLTPASLSVPVYSSAKSSISTFTQYLSKYAAPKVRVNAIEPYLISSCEKERNGEWSFMRNKLASETPLKIEGHPQDIATIVKMMIANKYLTGSIVKVTGGI